MAASRAARVLARKLISLPLLTKTCQQRSRKHLMYNVRLLTTSSRCCCEKPSADNDSSQQQPGNPKEEELKQGKTLPDSVDVEIKDQVDEIASAVPAQSEEIKTDLMRQLQKSSKNVSRGEAVYLTLANGGFSNDDKSIVREMCMKYGTLKRIDSLNSQCIKIVYGTKEMAEQAIDSLHGTKFHKTTLKVSLDKPTNVQNKDFPKSVNNKRKAEKALQGKRRQEVTKPKDDGKGGTTISKTKFKMDGISSQNHKKGVIISASVHHGYSKDFWIQQLFHGEPLGLFKPEDVVNSSDPDLYSPALGREKTLWDEIDEETLQLRNKAYVQNGFQEMVELTKEGKLWQFPIDNEQGLEEKNVPFHEHVFLDHLIDDFPKKGPIRHFMHLVVVGLSKNPYLSVQEKHDHINWYRTYFKSKESVLVEALGEAGKMGEPVLHTSSEVQQSVGST